MITRLTPRGAIIGPRLLWAIAILLGLLTARHTLEVVAGGASTSTDLLAYVAAAERLLNGEPIYWLPVDPSGDPPSYLYPPLLALVFTLLGPYHVAWWIWVGFSLLCWVGALALALTELRAPLSARLGERGWPLLAAALLVFPPLSAHFIWGQVGLLILICLTGSWWCLRRGREGWAGALLGLAIAVKLYPALIALPLLAGRRWRAVAMAAAVSAALVGGSFLAVGVDQTLFYVRELLPATGDLGTGDEGNYALRELLPGPLAAAGGLAILGLLAWLGRRIPAADSLSLGTTAVLLISPVVWSHYFVLALLPWLAALARASQRELWLLGPAYALIATASAVYYVPLALVPLAHALPTLGAILLFAVQVLQAWPKPATS